MKWHNRKSHYTVNETALAHAVKVQVSHDNCVTTNKTVPHMMCECKSGRLKILISVFINE